MKKTELITNVSNKVGLTKNVTEGVIDAIIDEITQALVNGDKIMFKGFIGFETSTRAARRACNPQTGEVVEYPEVKTVRCKISQNLKNAINGRSE